MKFPLEAESEHDEKESRETRAMMVGSATGRWLVWKPRGNFTYLPSEGLIWEREKDMGSFKETGFRFLEQNLR